MVGCVSLFGVGWKESQSNVFRDFLHLTRVVGREDKELLIIGRGDFSDDFSSLPEVVKSKGGFAKNEVNESCIRGSQRSKDIGGEFVHGNVLVLFLDSGEIHQC